MVLSLTKYNLPNKFSIYTLFVNQPFKLPKTILTFMQMTKISQNYLQENRSNLYLLVLRSRNVVICVKPNTKLCICT